MQNDANSLPNNYTTKSDLGKEKPPKFCKWCNEYLDPEWAAPKAVFCSRKCLNAEWYSRNKPYHRKKYDKEKRDWERSNVGRRAGTSWRYWWIYIPDFFK